MPDWNTLRLRTQTKYIINNVLGNKENLRTTTPTTYKPTLQTTQLFPNNLSIQQLRTLRTYPHLQLQWMVPTNQSVTFHTSMITKKHNRILKHGKSPRDANKSSDHKTTDLNQIIKIDKHMSHKLSWSHKKQQSQHCNTVNIHENSLQPKTNTTTNITHEHIKHAQS